MEQKPSFISTWRVLIIGVIAVILVAGAALVIKAVGQPVPQEKTSSVNVLTNSTDPCVVCHAKETAGIFEQYGGSKMAAAKVSCQDCHVVEKGYPGSNEHEGYSVLASPTTARCQNCHQEEVAQFYQSRHSLPAYVAVWGSKELDANATAMYKAIPEGSFAPDKSRNSIAAIEKPELTRFTCETCHNIGKPAADGSAGQCQKCHLRHTFSLEQARKPETCNARHIGPDHPQWEIYQESPHGIAYATSGTNWHWEAAPGTLKVTDFPAPTCAICHMSGFGSSTTTHDVGDRLSWFLFSQVSVRRPDWQGNLGRMQAVCFQCHNAEFINTFYSAADIATERVNELVKEADVIMQPLKDNKLLSDAPFDEPLDFVYFDLWHYYGRTSKFGLWMQGPDYAQWHGAYELLSRMSELRSLAQDKLQKAGITPGP